MRMFRARKKLNLGILESIVIFKGQMFFLDDMTELPGYTVDTVLDDWQELTLYNNFGQIHLTPK